MQHFKSLSEYLAYLELPRPEHPMLSVFCAVEQDFLPCARKSSPPISNDCYTISFKKNVQGSLNYGRTKFDFSNGSLFFLAPRQVMQWEDTTVSNQQGFSILIHEDYLKGTPLAAAIHTYGFFSYSINEALHLSPKEEQQMEFLAQSIHAEYHNNQDEYSKEIIIAHLETLLKYANRFYERQFLNRKELSHRLLAAFNQLLSTLLQSNQFQQKGIPSIEFLAAQLDVSQRYLSDTLKKETGKTAIEHLHLYLVDAAKNSLLDPLKSISEVAFLLGFEYPAYFSRLFKKVEGMSPTQYRERYRVN